MGIGKLGKKLIKVGRKTERTLGKRGKQLAEAVVERAISILVAELKGAEDRKSATVHHKKRSSKNHSATAETKPRRGSTAKGMNRSHSTAPTRSPAPTARTGQKSTKAIAKVQRRKARAGAQGRRAATEGQVPPSAPLLEGTASTAGTEVAEPLAT